MLVAGPRDGLRSRPDGLGSRRTFNAEKPEANRFSRRLFRAIARLAAVLAVSAVLTPGLTPAFAQTGSFVSSPVPTLEGVYPAEPPQSVQRGNPLAKPADATPIGEWALLPTMRVYSFNDTNLYESPFAMSAAGLRLFPTLLAQWTNGIHSTTLYGQVDTRQYPELSASNTFDRQAGIIQRYEMFRDLTFSVNGDYTHETNAAVLRGAIPGSITTPGTPTPGTGSGSDQGPTAINPFDQFTGTASVEKIFNRGFIKLSASVSRTDYENQNLSPDFTVKAFRGNGAFWLGPLLYAYADGAEAFTAFVTGDTASAFNTRAGIGTAKIGLFRASVYVGRQGSESQSAGGASDVAGGIIFGGKFSYYATPFWTLGLQVDETQNISTGSASACSLAISTSTSPTTPVPVSTCDSTWIHAVTLRSDYKLSRRWSAYARFDYEHIQFLDVPRLDVAWVASTGLRYEIERNTTLTLDYQHTRSTSDAPLVGFVRDYVTMGVTRKL